jgi:hypothetical protein
MGADGRAGAEVGKSGPFGYEASKEGVGAGCDDSTECPESKDGRTAVGRATEDTDWHGLGIGVAAPDESL